jgi:mono/diheme cytochrome c family protein
MRNVILPFAVAAAVVAGTALAQDRAPAGSAERGKQLYVELACYSCHAMVGQGGGRGAWPKISRPIMAWPAFAGLIRRPPRDMPAYTQKWVSDQDVADIYSYLISLKPTPALKDIPLLNQM